MSIRRKERIQNGAVKNLSTSIMADTFHSEELFGTMNPQSPLVTFVWECACTSTIGMYLDTMPFLIAHDYFKLGNISNKEVSKAYHYLLHEGMYISSLLPPTCLCGLSIPTSFLLK